MSGGCLPYFALAASGREHCVSRRGCPDWYAKRRDRFSESGHIGMTSQRNVDSKRLDRGEPKGSTEIMVDYAGSSPFNSVVRSAAPRRIFARGRDGIF